VLSLTKNKKWQNLDYLDHSYTFSVDDAFGQRGF